MTTDVRSFPASDPHAKLTQIRASRGFFDLELDAVWQARELAFVLVSRDLKVLYRQAVLGIAWAIIQPIFAVLIFSIVFGHFARLPSDGVPYPVFAFAGMAPWIYFSEAMRRSSFGLVNESDLVRKVFFPRMIISLAAITTPLVDFAITSLVVLRHDVVLRLRSKLAAARFHSAGGL